MIQRFSSLSDDILKPPYDLSWDVSSFKPEVPFMGHRQTE